MNYLEINEGCSHSYTAEVTTAATGHSYVTGTCTVCGGADPDYVSGTVTAKAFTLSFEDEILVNLYFTVTDMEAVEMGMLIFNENPAAPTFDAADEVYSTAVYNSSNGYYMSTTDGIAAKSMDDTYYAAAFYTSDNQLRCTGVIAYSLSKYCMGKADDEASDMQAFCAATAVYGYHAKVYFS